MFDQLDCGRYSLLALVQGQIRVTRRVILSVFSEWDEDCRELPREERCDVRHSRVYGRRHLRYAPSSMRIPWDRSARAPFERR